MNWYFRVHLFPSCLAGMTAALPTSRVHAVPKYCSDSRRSNTARGKKANKQISLADQGLTRSFHWSRATSKTSFFLVF